MLFLFNRFFAFRLAVADSNGIRVVIPLIVDVFTRQTDYWTFLIKRGNIRVFLWVQLKKGLFKFAGIFLAALRSLILT